jgi:hypothetical protein
MLSRVRVRGYKCLHDVTVELGAFTVLIGRNDSGKSSFLQALAEPSLALLRWHPTDVKEVSRGEWTVALEGESGALFYDASQFNKPRFQHDGSEDTLNFLSRRQAEIWFGRHPELVCTDPVSLDPGQIAAHSPSKDAALEAFVASRGAGTAAHLASLALGDRERFDAIEASLHEVTGGRVKSLVVKDLGGSTYTLSFRLHDGTVVAASHMSQGLLLFVGFLALVQRTAMPGVLLIEEPERGLHPQRLVQVIATLRSLSERGVQVVVTTHSPDVISACAPGEVRIFHRRHPESATEVHRLPADFEPGAAREPLGHVWSARGDDGLLELAKEGPPLLVEASGD